MPLVDIRVLPHSKIGLWEIIEPELNLLSDLKPDAEEQKMLQTFTNEPRRKQRIACRLLLKIILEPLKSNILYDINGKPSLDAVSGHISFSHTRSLAAVIYSREHPVGIDVEEIKPRIERISRRFLSRPESEHLQKKITGLRMSEETGERQQNTGKAARGSKGRTDRESLPPADLELLYVYWCAKETLYKFYGKPGLDMKNDIIIHPFDYFCNQNGCLTANLITPEGIFTKKLLFEKIKGHMLVHTIS